MTNYNEEVATPLGEGFVQVRGTPFDLNGSPFLFNGFNSYWMMNVATEPADRNKVSDVFREAFAAGLSLCRMWAFSDGGDHALQISPGVYDELVFHRRKADQYVQWARNAGETVDGDDDFYTNAVVKGYYRRHVQEVLTRVNAITGIAYRDDPTVMAWELMNEPRCQVDYSGNTINEWVQGMAPYFNKHLLAVGMEGFYGDSIPDRKQYDPGYQFGTDFIRSNLVEEIDFGTIHAYPDVCHLEDSRTIIGKPLVSTEFGKSKKDPHYSLDVRDSYMNAVYVDIYDLARNGGAFRGGLVWQILAEWMDFYDDGYKILLLLEPSTNSVIAQQLSKVAALEHTL
ncbi:hypothetical protein CRG98_038441 [Punica granatum]|nr:hypothetical protein CRG98_038441 [Punica granatum]